MSFAAAFIAAAVCGALSGFGIGGGTLLTVYMTAIAMLPQETAQGINLLYFLPASAAALIFHFKNGLVDKKIALRAGICGAVVSALSAFAAVIISPSSLRTLFGVFLILTGASILLKKKPSKK